jgi:hypothetical protein
MSHKVRIGIDDVGAAYLMPWEPNEFEKGNVTLMRCEVCGWETEQMPPSDLPYAQRIADAHARTTHRAEFMRRYRG